MKKIKLLLVGTSFLFMGGLSTVHASALNASDSLDIHYSNGAFVYQVSNGRSYSSTDVSNNLTAWLGFAQTDFSFVPLKSEKGFGNTENLSFQQYYRGIAIHGAIVNVHLRNDVLLNMNGKIAQTQKSISVSPVINEAIAKSAAVKQLGLVKNIKSSDVMLTLLPNGNDFNKLQLAMFFDIEGENTNQKYVGRKVFVDANAGKVIKCLNNVLSDNINTTGNTYYYGKKDIVTNILPSATQFLLRDSVNHVMTFNAAGVDVSNTGFDSDVDYTNVDTVWDSTRILKNYVFTSIDSLGTGLNNRLFYHLILKGTNATQNVYDMDQAVSGDYVYGVSSLSTPYTADGEFMEVDTNAFYKGFAGKYTYSGTVLDSVIYNLSDLSIGTHNWSSLTGARTGTYTIANSLNPALDAHWGMEQTHKFYLNELSRNSYDNQGSVIKNYINGSYAVQGTQDNAAALQQFNVMVYGMGDNQSMGPVVGVDVMGHEFTHLVIANNGLGGLDYEGESGALNESFADMFGTAIEHYALDTASNWLMGDKVMLVAPYYFRSMSNPKSAVGSITYGQPDTYEGTYWTDPTNTNDGDEGGVHTNSGVGNKWFYLMINGGSGTNDKQTAYNVTGIGWGKGQKIAYSTITEYITPSSTYLEACNASLLAATNLYGASSDEYTTVRNAWIAVGVLDTNATTSTNNIASNNLNISIYPNPATSGQITIQSKDNGNVSALLYNSVGQSVKSINIHQGDNVIDLKGIAVGTYMFKMTDKTGASYTQKITIE